MISGHLYRFHLKKMLKHNKKDTSHIQEGWVTVAGNLGTIFLQEGGHLWKVHPVL